MVKKKDRFYADGLRFGCTGCGSCCQLDGGKVFLSEDELIYICTFLKMAFNDIITTFIQEKKDNKYILKDGDGDHCIFLNQNRCSVYPVRPIQCKTFPFWPENIKSLYRWKIIAEDCPGIDQGRLFTLDEIIEISNNRATVEILIYGDKE